MTNLIAEFSDFAPKLSGLGGTIRFDLGTDGTLLIDATGPSPRLAEGGDEADCTVKASLETLRKLKDGTLDPMLAYAMGRIKVSGSMPLAMKMASALA